MAEREAARAASVALERRRADARACTVTVERARGRARAPSPCGAVSSAITAAWAPRSGATPADDARAAPERHDRDRARSRTARARARSCSWPAGRTTASGAPSGSPAAQAHEVGIALAGGVQHAFGVLVADAVGADDRAQRVAAAPRPARAAAAGAPARAPPAGAGASRRRRLAQEAERVRSRAAGACAGSPHPHQRIVAAGTSATDPLQPVERLLDRAPRPRGAP